MATSEAPPTFLAQAYLRMQAEIRAQVIDERAHIHVGVPRVTTAIAGILPQLSRLRPELVAQITRFDTERFDALGDYAHALYYCHARHLASGTPRTALDPQLVARARALRNTMELDTRALVAGGIVPAHVLATVHKQNGHRRLMSDLVILVQAHIDHRAAIAGRCLTGEPQLREAMSLAQALMAAIGKRDAAPREMGEARRERIQAFFLLRDVYGAIRTSVQLVRHDAGDAHLFAPAVFVNPNSGRKPAGSASPAQERAARGIGLPDGSEPQRSTVSTS